MSCWVILHDSSWYNNKQYKTISAAPIPYFLLAATEGFLGLTVIIIIIISSTYLCG